MLAIFQYGFVLRAIEAGIIVAFLAPLIGTFLVLRRYSLIADTLAHVSLAGVALGLLLGFSPIYTALDRKSTRLNSSHRCISYAVFCLKKKKKKYQVISSKYKSRLLAFDTTH